MLRILILTLATLGFSAQSHAVELTPLVDADWLDRHLDEDNLVVLDVRSDIDGGGGRDAFEAAQIPGSLHTRYGEDGWRESRNDVAGLMPAVDELEQLIGGLGISNEHNVVIVPAGTGPTDFGTAARIYWSFKILGHDQVAILDGGFAGWQQQGFEVTSGPTPSVEPAPFQAELREALIATTEQVEEARQRQAQLVDARPSDYFTGETTSPAVREAGTIPGARSLPHRSHLNDRNGAFYLDTAGLDARINAAELSRDERTIAFCNTGHWAATDWFVLSEIAGFDDVAMYDGSMAAWTVSESRPVQLARRGLELLTGD
ncbi:thiosulfate/3-mercaptopyruvate sulfurtransferase [Franzmannia pantelleriensis]|uniref:Thiosulfate/3-mercaptopyruvate sulfurtransferase n=1 Tax=Franzmannia pantelleriensis TaxID=48727 RepID=A0A1G9JZ18_9GAMM|nr:sulfurtransferase [Halomonas pantelleriensis]SDL42758.1 thiosulfate/3-mercaptopyruvate sulfurtransferase [Halomonas pantelleriensis]